jgi:hypothetical protein
MSKKKKQMDKPFCWWMDGWQEASGADEMSDGAWGAVMQEGVRAYNEDNKTNFDEHEGWLYWIENRDGNKEPKK